MMMYACSFLLILFFLPTGVEASSYSNTEYEDCLIDTAVYYQINPELIDAIIRTESNHDPLAIHINTSGSEDVGLMQINTATWMPQIRKLGYDRLSLLDPCTNILVGTWILAQEVQRFGYTWSAVGAYNAGPSINKESRRSSYARRVFENLTR